MPKWVRRLVLFAMIVAGGSTAAMAQNGGSPAPDTRQIEARAKDVVRLFKGKEQAEDIFAPSFLAAVPPGQVDEVVAGLVQNYGRVRKVREIRATGPYAAALTIEFDRAFADVQMVIEPAPPHRITGLLFTGFRDKGAQASKVDFNSIAQDFAKLPGAAGFAVAEITPDTIIPVADYNATRSFGIGSTFKLYILAELAAQVDAGNRSWGDVVPLNFISVPSGVMQDWPRGTPVTLRQLASHMIAISDNTATDTLLFTLGREAVGRTVIASGHSNPASILPMMGTREFFALKMPQQADVRGGFLAAGDAGQMQILDANAGRLAGAPIDGRYLAQRPHYIDSIEWLASPVDVVRLLTMMQRMNNQTVLDILTINKGLVPSVTNKWRYLGFKGGSETGVINLSFLGQRSDGRWFVVTGSWNDTEAPLNEVRFIRLMEQLLNQTAAY